MPAAPASSQPATAPASIAQVDLHVAPATVSLVTSLEAAPGSVLAWATKPGPKTSEGLASVLAVPITAVASFLAAFATAHNLITSEQVQAVVSAGVPAVATAGAAYVVRGYTAARAAVKAEAVRLHFPPP